MREQSEQVRQGLVEMLPRLRRFARALSTQPADADDLVQVAIERALRNADQWQPDTRLDSWLFKITKNCWIDEIRRRKSQSRLQIEPDRADHDGAAAMAARLDAHEVLRAVCALPEDQRLAVALVLVDGVSYSDAAEILDIPIGTLTSRLARGRAAIGSRMAEMKP